MALPVGLRALFSFKGPKGEKGDTGALAFADAVTVPYGSGANAEMVGPSSNRGVLISVPEGKPGIPGANAVPTDAAVGAWALDADTETRKGIDAAVIASHGPGIQTAPRFLDAYAKYFTSPSMVWVPGQATTPTTLAAPAASGSNVLVVASAAGIVAGMTLVTDAGSVGEQLFRVTSVSGTDVSVTPEVSAALAAGAAIGPWWEDAIHPLAAFGGASYGRWLANAKVDGDYAIRAVPPGRPVVVLGDSWVARFFPRFTSRLAERIPGVETINAGVAGNTSAMMIARFATDVPANASYVLINEPGVNDAPTVSLDQQTANLQTLVELIRGIGAIPVFSGPVPLVNNQDQARAQALAFRAQLAEPEQYPALTQEQYRRLSAPTVRPEPFSLGIGERALERRTTGTHNAGIGYSALGGITTGAQNAALGYRALASNEAGNANTAVGANALAENKAGSNTAIGSLALAANTTGANSTAVGANALSAQTTAADNAALGSSALRRDTTGANNTAMGSSALSNNLTGNYNTAVGAYALLASLGSDNTAVGSLAGHGSGGTAANQITAIGSQATVSGARSVALGFGTAVTEPDQAGIGARSFFMRNVAVPATPAGGGVLYVEAGALKYKGSSGTITTLGNA